ncbi:hypothetical protein AQ490_13100 [Wenjunlia vitaminophila]|uniref:Uncharacterized protein n=1 Tax=Wenjunlia vitaminophila TaxID=76728 RepID=A0A0T6LXR2_WENVI|nr:hypothetical protein [Wenjunlia vitaminophila]KRV50884.1 hypothetical protein AQ490_13100 [Wenjunlia vitaminophila]
MARPTDWRPLADQDPVPGNPQSIREESSRMSDIGVIIRDQVNKLRQIGKDSTLKGKYANELRTAASDLAGKLDKTAGRYEQVSGHLSTWASELEHAQSLSIQALNMAPSQNAVDTAGAKPSKKTEDMTKEEREAEQTRKDAAKKTNEALEAAKSKLREATSHRDKKEDEIAGKIRKSIDDDVEDSWWDNVKDFVDKYADVIKIVIDVISWVATAVAIIAMFVPGLNVVMFLLIAGLIVVAGRSLLAATGNASWMEVAVDTFGLLTMGVGRAGMAALKGANATAKASSIAARRGMVKAAMRNSSAQRQQLGRVLNSKTASAAQKRAAKAQIDALKRQARRGAPSVPMSPTPVGGKLAKVLNQGDTEGVALLNNVNRMANRFPEAVTTVNKARLGYGTAQAANWGGLGVDLGDKTFGNADSMPFKPYNEGYNDWKGSTWQAPVGSTW